MPIDTLKEKTPTHYKVGALNVAPEFVDIPSVLHSIERGCGQGLHFFPDKNSVLEYWDGIRGKTMSEFVRAAHVEGRGTGSGMARKESNLVTGLEAIEGVDASVRIGSFCACFVRALKHHMLGSHMFTCWVHRSRRKR